MATATNWSTKPSSISEHGFFIHIDFHVDADDVPLNPDDADASPAIQVEQTARISMRTKLTPDDGEQPRHKTLYYRAAGATIDSDRYPTADPEVFLPPDGKDPAHPLPFTEGVAADLTALKAVVIVCKKQINKDANNDIEV